MTRRFGARRMRCGARSGVLPAAMRRTLGSVVLTAAVWAGVFLTTGCATHERQRAAVERAMVSGDYTAALAELDKKHRDPQDVLHLLDRGLLLHYLGRHDESNDEFEAAEIRIEDLYTRSLSKAAVSLATSDVVIPFDGAPFERALIHYYRTLNYLHDDNLEDALVECRKVNLLLATLAEKTEGKATAYQDDAFLQYLTALLYEDAGQWNDAWVSLRAAETAFARYDSLFGVPPPPMLGGDLRRLSRDLGYSDEYQGYRARYPEASDTLPSGCGELVLLFENGLAPTKEEIELTLPILKGERERCRDRDELALLLVGRYGGYDYPDAELEYLLRVAIPEIHPRPPLVRFAEVRVGDTVARTVVVENVAALSQAALAEAMPKILLKTVIRGITKYLATRGIEKKVGRIGGFLANLLTAASEQADTRGWISLPNDIQMARLAVPPGEHDVNLRFLDARGDVVATAEAGPVAVAPGRRTYLSWREWE
jgi:hypothetical protein